MIDVCSYSTILKSELIKQNHLKYRLEDLQNDTIRNIELQVIMFYKCL